jgi:tetraacyldisaccharide 4'-kinase
MRLTKSQIDCFVLDDGFQYLNLKRDADIVLVDATNPFGGGFLLPAGPLRERASALSRADFVVISRSEHSPAIESIIRRHSMAPVFYAQTQLRAVVQMDHPLPGNRTVEFRPHRYLVFCGIGNPQAFRDDLSRWGIQSLGTTFFQDHHRYTQPEAEQLEKLAMAMGATALLCTEKDIFNLDHVHFRLLPVHFCQIDLQMKEEGRFFAAVSDATAKKPAVSPSAVTEAYPRHSPKEHR